MKSIRGRKSNVRYHVSRESGGHDTSLKLPTWNDTSSKLSGWTMNVAPAAWDTTLRDLERIVQSSGFGGAAVTFWHSQLTVSIHVSVSQYHSGGMKVEALTGCSALAFWGGGPALSSVPLLKGSRANSFAVASRWG